MYTYIIIACTAASFHTYLFYSFHYSGLRLVITPVLAGLLETDFMKMMNFKDFFEEVERIAKLKVRLSWEHSM